MIAAGAESTSRGATLAARVLVIDDSTTVRKLVEIALRGSPCTVELAASGADGLARARAARPDVILLDYRLPDLTGVAVCEALAAGDHTAGIPVVVMSAAYREVAEAFRPFTAVVDFVGKPFSPAELRAHVERALARAGGARRAEVARGVLPPIPPVSRLAAAVEAPGHSPPSGLELRAALTAAPVSEVLHLLAAAVATGVLAVEGATRMWVYLRRGEVMLVAAAGDRDADLARVPPAVGARIGADAARGKPVAVGLAEAGLAPIAELPAVLLARSTSLLAELLEVREGWIAWHPAGALPDFAEAFGRPVSLTAALLRRGPRGHAPSALGDTLVRAPRFSARLAGVRLDADEQRVLGLVDGQLTVREVIARAELAHARAIAVIARLRAAELVRVEARLGRSGPAALVGVLDVDAEGVIEPLRAYLRQRPEPLEVLAIGEEALVAWVERHRPRAILAHAARIAADSVHQVLIEAQVRGATTIAVLERASAARTEALLHAGFHAVLIKPFHAQELERVLGP